jgi:hypothetical protein
MASISSVSISNRALSHLKANNRITSLEEESLEARLCNLYFSEVLDSLLEKTVWNFATHRETLSLSAVSPIYEYDYKFQLPTDPYCLKVIEAVDSGAGEITDWQIEARYLLCNSATCLIKYTKRVEQYNELSIGFRDAMEYRLASKMAEALTGSTSIKKDMYNEYVFALKKAMTADARQGSPEEETDNDYEWTIMRFS